MGRLAGFRYREVATRLRRNGFELAATGKGSHEVWVNAAGRRTVVPRHPGDIPEGTLKGILRLAGISVEEFLA